MRGPGLGDHSRDQLAEAPQVAVRQPIEDTDLRLHGNEGREENVGKERKTMMMMMIVCF